MQIIFRAYYDIYEYDKELLKRCEFIDENNNKIYEPRIYEYFIYIMTGDLYLSKDIDETLNFIHQVENNPNHIHERSGQGFSWEISAQKVVFYNNIFDEEDGWPNLSCSLSLFKTILLAWHTFLQLPKNIYSKLEIKFESE